MGYKIPREGLGQSRQMVVANSRWTRYDKNYLYIGLSSLRWSTRGSNHLAHSTRPTRVMYADRGYSTTNLQLQFVLDLIQKMQQWQTAGHDIVLMMDVNEPSGHGSAVDRFIYACGLTNVHTRSTETVNPPPTYHRGRSKNDIVLVTHRVAQAVTSRTSLPIHDSYLLDNRALLVNFDASKLFAGPTSEVVLPCV